MVPVLIKVLPPVSVLLTPGVAPVVPAASQGRTGGDDEQECHGVNCGLLHRCSPSVCSNEFSCFPDYNGLAERKLNVDGVFFPVHSASVQAMLYTLSGGACESCVIDYELREQESIIGYRVS